MSMSDVYEDIYAYAKQYIKSNSNYSPQVLKTPPTETKVFPVVIIQESNDTLEKESLNKEDQQFKVEIEIEIYAIDKGSISRQVILQELKSLVNDVFDTHFGMYRRACVPTPNADRNVDRLYMRYNAIVDENKRIFRR